MKHVFVETNWIIDFAAPLYRQIPAAKGLFDRANAGEIELHVPALCIPEARRKIRRSLQPRFEADPIRSFVRSERDRGTITDVDREAVMRLLSRYEADVNDWFRGLDATLQALSRAPGIDLFPLNDRQLELSIELSFQVDLQVFDHSILAAVLGRAEEIRQDDVYGEFAFCTRDADLWPWHKKTRETKKELRDLYDGQAVWVYGDFEMTSPARPDGWPERQPPADP